MGKQLRSIGGVVIQDFIADPSKSMVPDDAATITIDVIDSAAIKVNCLSACTYYFNTDTTKTFPIAAAEDTVIMTAHSMCDQVVIVNTSETNVYIQRM